MSVYNLHIKQDWFLLKVDTSMHLLIVWLLLVSFLGGPVDHGVTCKAEA